MGSSEWKSHRKDRIEQFMADQIITAKILRFDPSVDAAPEYKEYQVPWKEYITGLEVLYYITENMEELTFDSSCKGSMCGRCSMMINGEPALACWTTLQPGEVTFEPLKGFPVIKDLVVDHAFLTTKLTESHLAVETNEEITRIPNIDYKLWKETLLKLNLCKECGCCYAACPVLLEEHKYHKFAGPAALMQVAMRYYDPKDKRDRLMQAVTTGLFDCTLCGECVKVCPATIPHTVVIKELQTAAEEKGYKPAA